MSEAPKKIWVRELPRKDDGVLIGLSYHTEPEGLIGETEIPYIRADIVDELVESLQKCWMVMNGGGTWTLEDQDKTKAALAKARGEG